MQSPVPGIQVPFQPTDRNKHCSVSFTGHRNQEINLLYVGRASRPANASLENSQFSMAGMLEACKFLIASSSRPKWLPLLPSRNRPDWGTPSQGAHQHVADRPLDVYIILLGDLFLRVIFAYNRHTKAIPQALAYPSCQCIWALGLPALKCAHGRQLPFPWAF
jgi:hypothetical protein